MRCSCKMTARLSMRQQTLTRIPNSTLSVLIRLGIYGPHQKDNSEQDPSHQVNHQNPASNNIARHTDCLLTRIKTSEANMNKDGVYQSCLVQYFKVAPYLSRAGV